MIGVNITIIIQMVNFYIAFVLLKNLLFKPAIKYLQEEEKREQNIVKKISIEQESIQEKIEVKNKDWLNYKKYFKQNCPKYSEAKPIKIPDKASQVSEEEIESEISQKEIDNIAKHVEKALLERIEND